MVTIIAAKHQHCSIIITTLVLFNDAQHEKVRLEYYILFIYNIFIPNLTHHFCFNSFMKVFLIDLFCLATYIIHFIFSFNIFIFMI